MLKCYIFPYFPLFSIHQPMLWSSISPTWDPGLHGVFQATGGRHNGQRSQAHGLHLHQAARLPPEPFFLSFLGDANGGDFWWYNDINRHIYIYTLYIDIFISVNMWDNIWLYIHMSIYIYDSLYDMYTYIYIYNLYMFLYAIYLRFISISKYYIYIHTYMYIYFIYIYIYI